MLEMVQRLLLDYQESRPMTGVPRRLDIRPIPGKATVCIGVRRAGKSTFMNQVANRLEAGGVSRQNLAYLNLFDDRLRNLRNDGLGIAADAYNALYPHKQGKEQVYWFLDEIQSVPGWESFVERLLRTEYCEVYLTGSSAKLLATEIATEMRGRALTYEVFPFSFGEMLDSAEVGTQLPLTSARQAHVINVFERFWESGGFPEVVELDSRRRSMVHQEYFQTILFRDLVERHDVPHPKALLELAHWLVDNIASMYSLNRLVNYIGNLGYKISKYALSDYLMWLEDAYFFFSVRLFDASVARSNANPKKIYCIDHSMVRSVSSGLLLNNGHLLENLVFTALRRHTNKIFYYRTRTGREVDFLAVPHQAHPLLIQVCESLVDPATRRREVDALASALVEQTMSLGYIVTRNEEATINVPQGSIRVVPVWLFLLQLEAGALTLPVQPPG